MTNPSTAPVNTQALHDDLVREGWKARDLPGFIGRSGPLWTRRGEDGWSYGFAIGPQHLNPARVAHGGALTTLLDHVISTVAWEAAGRAPCVTLQLDTHFLAAVREGAFAQARAEVAHRTGGLLFMTGSVSVEGSPVLTAQAILKVLAPARAGAG